MNDLAVRGWVRSGDRFEGRFDGDGLVLTWRKDTGTPFWKFRYRFAGKPRVMNLGSHGNLPLSAARQAAKELRAKVTLGHDVAGEKRERKTEALAKIEAARTVMTVGKLADEYFERRVLGKREHPNIVRSRIEKDIKPNIGKLALEGVEPRHIDAMLQTVVKRAAALSRDELKTLFKAMRTARGFSVENAIAVKRLLLLALRKGELIAARWNEFELDADVPVWRPPGKRTKTGQSIDIPLPTIDVEWLRELSRLALGSQWVLPARKMQSRMLPNICESTVGVAMGKVKHGLPHFTTYDFRRTARTHLAALGVALMWRNAA